MSFASFAWLLGFSAFIALVFVVFFRAWRRQRMTFAACPRCHTHFDPHRWKIVNRRRHYHGRYTITPVYVCPQCGFEMTFTDRA